MYVYLVEYVGCFNRAVQWLETFIYI